MKQKIIRALVYIRDTFAQNGTFFRSFALHPLRAMYQIPPWDWKELATLHLTIMVAISCLRGLVARNPLKIFGNIIYDPFISVFTVLVFAALFFYFGRLWLRLQPTFENVVRLVAVASWPGYLIWIGGPIHELFAVVGIGVSCLLISVGLIGVLKFPKKPAVVVTFGLYAVFLTFWLSQQVTHWMGNSRDSIKATPSSIKILEDEIE